MIQTFETERLILRPTLPKDAAFILELLNSPKWLKYIGDRNVHTTKAAELYIRNRMMPQQELLGYSNYTVIRKDDQQKLGTAGLYDREGLEGIDIGFAFLPDYEGQGYAYESASKLVELAKSDFNIDKICAITVPYNQSSQRLLEKLGLKYIKTIRIENDDEDLMYYELVH